MTTSLFKDWEVPEGKDAVYIMTLRILSPLSRIELTKCPSRRSRPVRVRPFEEHLPQIVGSLKALRIKSLTDLEQMTTAIIHKFSSEPHNILLLFEKCQDIKITTVEKGVEYVTTVQSMLKKIVFSECEKLEGLRRNVEKLAGRYRGPRDKREAWVRVQVDRYSPIIKLRFSLKLWVIRVLFAGDVLSHEDLFVQLDKLVKNPHESSLFGLCTLLKEFGRCLEYGLKGSPSACKVQVPEDGVSDPRIIAYFGKLTEVLDDKDGNDLCLEVKKMVEDLVKLRNSKKW